MTATTVDTIELTAAIDSFVNDFATLFDQHHIVDPNAKHIENYTIEVLLTRVDEFKRLALLVASDANRARHFLPQLAKQAKDLEQVFASIDAACALVDRGAVLARELDERVTKAERELTTRTIDPRNVLSARRRATAIAGGIGPGARDSNGQPLVTEFALTRPAPAAVSAPANTNTTTTAAATPSTTTATAK